MIAIIDYQMGNLRSVQKGFERIGAQATITSDPRDIEAADKVVLPGVGAFRDAAHELKQRELWEPIRSVIASGKPFLGICLGLQLLFDTSYEDGEHEGLGVIPGKVVRFDLPRSFKVPHMGWNEIEVVREAPILRDIPDGTHFYFVHSYHVVPDEPGVTALRSDYHQPFCAMIWYKNLFATQFHPEKSQSQGLKILSNFAQL